VRAAVVEQVTASAYAIPTDQPEADGTAMWDSTGLVVVEVTADGMTGTGWTYGPAACADLVADVLAPLIMGSDALHVQRTWLEMVRGVRNDTRAGGAGYAISACDVALWDLKAKVLDLPLADLFGSVRRQVPVYGSGGFTTYSDERTVDQLRHWANDQHLTRVKIKIGQSRGGCVDRDLERIHLSRQAIGPDVGLMVDANGAYTAKQAVRVAHRMSECDVDWFEEPVSSDDLAGLRHVRAAVSCDVAAGEYGTDATYFERMAAAEAVDCLQVDATRCGGFTEWFRAAAVAAGHQLEVSAHCAPNLHACAAAATLNLRHIEWFHDHVRIESEFFDGALDPTGGSVAPSDRPGHGLTFQAERAAEFRAAVRVADFSS
jgi:L-alanine-DL-glutamate epimerase-like enolase superfamily enzyme